MCFPFVSETKEAKSVIQEESKPSKYYGVCIQKKEFRAYITGSGVKTRRLGHFETELEAAMATDAELFKEGKQEKMNCARWPEDFSLVGGDT